MSNKQIEIARFKQDRGSGLMTFAKEPSQDDTVYYVERFGNGVFLSMWQNGMMIQRNPLKVTHILSKPVPKMPSSEVWGLINQDPMYLRHKEQAEKHALIQYGA